MDPLDQVGDPSKGQYGVLKIQTSPLGTESTSGTDLNGKQDINFISFKYRMILDLFIEEYFFELRSRKMCHCIEITIII